MSSSSSSGLYSKFHSTTPPSPALFAAASQIHANTVLSHKNLDVGYVCNLSLEEQASYSDPITIANVNELWVVQQVQPMDLSNPGDVSVISSINATAIGNFAYIALYCNLSEAKECAKENIKLIVAKVQSTANKKGALSVDNCVTV